MLVRFARVCVPFLIVSSALSAQEASSTQTAKVPAKETCSIAGVVVKLGTNEPLSKAHVLLYKWDNPRSGYSTQTDGSGHFAILKIEPGRYRLQVQRTGYLSQFYGEDPSARRGAVLALSSGNDIPDLLFHMVPPAIISGRITDEDGEPIPHVVIEAMRRNTWEGRRQLQIYGQAQTNDLGEFRLSELAKGRYLLRAKFHDWRLAPKRRSIKAQRIKLDMLRCIFPGPPTKLAPFPLTWRREKKCRRLISP